MYHVLIAGRVYSMTPAEYIAATYKRISRIAQGLTAPEMTVKAIQAIR